MAFSRVRAARVDDAVELAQIAAQQLRPPQLPGQGPCSAQVAVEDLRLRPVAIGPARPAPIAGHQLGILEAAGGEGGLG